VNPPSPVQPATEPVPAVPYTYDSLAGYNYTSDDTADQFDWNITLVDPLEIQKPYISQGIYAMSTNYLLDDRSYTLEVLTNDCRTKPSPENAIIFSNDKNNNTIDSITKENFAQLYFEYNQTSIEESDLWTANKTGGNVEFCVKVRNFLEEDGDPFGREIHFLEVTYRIEVDSLTNFNHTIDIIRTDATDGGVEKIDYEEDITVYQCKDNYDEITSPPALTQGDFLQLCVKTVSGSAFGVHSIKELDVSQDSINLYPYIDGFVTSPLAYTECKDDNTTGAICRAKMQLISAYFENDDPLDLFANGTVKLDYVGRGRYLSVDVQANYMANPNTVNKNRVLEGDDEKSPSFGLEIEVTSPESSSGTLNIFCMGNTLSAVIVLLGVGFF